MCDLCAEIAKQLFQPELKYADVIASFRNLPSDKRKEIAKKHNSFVDWITSSCNKLEGGNEVDFTYLLHKVVSEKIHIGLTAIGSMKINEIQSTLMHTTEFVSDGLLTRILSEFPEFTVTSSESGDVVKLSNSQPQMKKIAIPIPSSSDSKVIERRKDQLKFLFREKPDVIACLSVDVTWELIIKAHIFWKKHCASSSADLTAWLSNMTSCHSACNLSQYHKALRACLLKRSYAYIQDKPRSVKQILEFLCATLERVTSEYFIYAACCENCDLVDVEKPEANATISSYVVSAKGSNSKSKSRTNTLIYVNPGPKKTHFPFGLPAECLSRIKPLLTSKVSYNNLVDTHNQLREANPKVMEKAIFTFGCFLEFLLQFFKHIKSTEDSELYSEALARQLTIMICQKLYSTTSLSVPWTEIIETLAPTGFADSKFIHRTLESSSGRFSLANGAVTMIDGNNKQSTVKRPFSITARGHPVLQVLFGEQIIFEDLFQSFLKLSDDEKADLALHGRSFIAEHFRRYKSGNYCVHRKHINKLIFQEVLSLVESRLSIQVSLAQRIITKGNLSFISCGDILYSLSIFPSKMKINEDMLIMGDFTTVSSHPAETAPVYEGTKSTAVSAEVWTAQEVHNILRRSSSCQNRMADLLSFEHGLSEEYRRTLVASYGTFTRFINTTVTEASLFRDIVNSEAANCLESRTMLASDLLVALFGNKPSFMSEFDLVDILNQTDFVMLQYDRSILVSQIRSSGIGRIRYFDQMEQMVVETVRCLFVIEGCTLPFNIMYTRVSSSGRFTKLQRIYLFGTSQDELQEDLSEIFFRRFLLMYPDMFTVQGDDVVIAPTRPSPRQSTSSPDLELNKSLTKCCDSERESGEVSDGEEQFTTKNQRKRETASKKSADNETKPKRKRRKRSSRSKQRSEVEEKATVQVEPGLIQDVISLLPPNLIQDVTMGRLLAAEGNQMIFQSLIDCLTTSLLNEAQRTLVTVDEKTCEAFKTKVLESLEPAEQVHVGKAKDGTRRIVKLVLKQAERHEENVAVFRHASSLTRVKNKDLANFIRALVSIQGAEIDVETVVSAARRKYSKTKLSPHLSDDVIACQVVGCLHRDPQMLLDPIEATCCLGKRGSSPRNLLDCLGDVKELEVATYVLHSLKTEHSSGVTLEELTDMVIKQFGPRLKLDNGPSLHLTVRYLVLDAENVGFTSAGKIAPLGNNVPDNDIPTSPYSENEQATNIHSTYSSDKMKEPMKTSSYIPSDSAGAASDVIRLEPHQQRDTRLCSTVGVERTTSRPHDANPPATRSNLFKPIERKLSGEEAKEAPSSTTHGVELSPQQQNVVSCSRESMHEARKAKRLDRSKKMQIFLVEFLSGRNCCCETDVVVEATRKRFCEERFARSSLALEAYVREFVALGSDQFAFGNRYGDVGVTWTFYRPHCAVTTKPELPLVGLAKQLIEFLQVHLLGRSGNRDTLDGLCQAMSQRFAARLEAVHESERLPICRTLILLFCIRNLDKFVFSKAESVLGLRRETLEKTVQSLGASMTPMSPARRSSSEEQHPIATPSQRSEISNKSKAERRREEAVKLVAEILTRNGPCGKTHLRDLWSRHANDEVRKVLGSGVSFLLDLRKFDKYFPAGEDGRVTLNEIEYRRFLEQI